MIDPRKMMDNFEAQDSVIASLRAENERLTARVEQLEEVADCAVDLISGLRPSSRIAPDDLKEREARFLAALNGETK